MSSLTEWQSQLEDRYILNFERALEVRQRRNQLLAEWIVAKNRRNDPAYVEKIVQIGSEEPADAGYRQRIMQEMGGVPADVGEQQLQEHMRTLLLLAAEQLAREHERRADNG
jgi:hypothetical protein